MIGVALTCVLQTALMTTGAQPYADAYRESIDHHRPLLVMVGADWCPACVSMKRGVLSRMQQSGKLDRVSFTIVDSDRDRKLSGLLKRGSTVPQLIIYHNTADGWRAKRLVGGQSEASIQRLIDGAVRDTVPVVPASVEITP